jgi:hypothetical protein
MLRNLFVAVALVLQQKESPARSYVTETAIEGQGPG